MKHSTMKDTFGYFAAPFLGNFILITPVFLIYPVAHSLKEAKILQPVIFGLLAAGVGSICNLVFNYARSLQNEDHAKRLNFIAGRLLDSTIVFVYCILGSLALLPLQSIVDRGQERYDAGDKLAIEPIWYNITFVAWIIGFTILSIALFYTVCAVILWLAQVQYIIINKDDDGSNVEQDKPNFVAYAEKTIAWFIQFVGKYVALQR